MAGVKITGAEHPLKEIFSDQFVFEIPAYQRPYSWTTEEAGALIEDLLDAIETDDPDDPDPYFLGSVVLAKEEGSSLAKVIDGQQRLTTITILLAAIACSFDKAEGDKIRHFIRQEGNTFAGTSDVMRLTLRPRDASFFQMHVQSADNLTPLLNLDVAQLENDAQRNVQANAGHFVDRLKEVDDDQRRRLAQFLISNCFLVAVSTPDRDSAYRIFAVLNDRGLDLSHADIIKSELIGSIADDNSQDLYTKKWEDIEAELGTEAFRDLFSHIRTIYAKNKQRGALLKEFREYVLDHVNDPQSFIDDVVAPWGDVFIRIRQQSWESTSHADAINTWLEWLGRIDNFDWIPPAIIYLHLYRNDAPRVVDFLRRLERLAATMYVRRFGINPRIERYSALLNEIEIHGDVLANASALDLTAEERSATLHRLNGDVYLDKPRLYILLRLDDAKSAGGVNYHHKIITVEHVLPQNPASDSAWVEIFNDEDRQQWTHRLANLVLLPRRKNSAAQNFEFDIKKSKYFAGADGASPFLLTMEVLQAPQWTPALMVARQTQVVDVLKGIWEL
jgi:hypothetical protein